MSSRSARSTDAKGSERSAGHDDPLCGRRNRSEMDVMKPMVSTSVLGLVPLPQQLDNNESDWKRETNVESASPRPLGSGEYCQLTQHSASHDHSPHIVSPGCRCKGNSELAVALNKMLSYSEIQRVIVSALRRFFL